MDAFILDDRFFPLVVNVLPSVMELESLSAFLAKTDRLLARRTPYVTITDARALQLPNATVRKHIADWSKKAEPLMALYTAGTAIVIGSALVRGGLTALFWLAPPPYPAQVVATLIDGLDVAGGYLAARGIDTSCVARFRADMLRASAGTAQQ